MEYEDLVSKIIAAEHSAQEIARELRERQDSLDADLKRDTDRMREDYFARARRRVEQVRAAEEKAAQEDMARWDKKREAALARVERAYAENREKWVDALFTRIVGEEPS